MLAAGLYLILGENGIEVVYPPIEPARPIEFVSLEASSEVVEGYWSTAELNSYNIPLDSIPERTLVRLDGAFSCPYGRDVFSHYGRRHGRNHRGVDIPVPPGTRVVAAFDGIVRLSTYHRGYGNIIIIRHPNGLETCYAHLSERKVKSGDVVSAGDLIALSGSTGRSTGPHLHFETLFCGHSFDPESFIDIRGGTLRSGRFFMLHRERLD